MSTTTATPTRAAREITVRACEDRRYETIEIVIAHNEFQTSVTALTPEEALVLIGRLADHLLATR